MSMLLEALKKSEEQRQLGTTPDIHSPSDHSPRDDGGTANLWLPAGLIAVAVVAMAWFGWKQFERPAPTLVSPQIAERAAGAEPASGGTVEQRQPAVPSGARTPVENFAGAATGTTDGASPGAESAPERQQVSRSFNQFQAPESDPATDQASATPAADAQPVREAPAATQSIASDPGEAATDAPFQPEPMSYWELPQGVRDNLPEFRVTVLVYAEDPSQRFLLINGLRLKEKDELQSGVVLDEIRRDGAVFRARSYRFLVKG